MTRLMNVDIPDRSSISRPQQPKDSFTKRLRAFLFGLAFLSLIASNIASLTSNAFNTFVGGLLGTMGLATVYSLLDSNNKKLKTLSNQQAATIKKQAASANRLKANSASETKRIKALKGTIAQQNTNIKTLQHKNTKLQSVANGYKTASGKWEYAHKAQALNQSKAASKVASSIASRSVRVAKASLARIPAEAIPYAGAAILVGGTAYELKAMCEDMDDLNTLYKNLGLQERVDSSTLNTLCHPSLPSVDALISQINLQDVMEETQKRISAMAKEITSQLAPN